MPRPENPLDPAAGPIAEFAVRLRQLRAGAGGLSYRAMSGRSYYGHTILSEAASGRRLPTWEVTRAYVTACGGDVQEWERHWREAAHAAGRSGKEGDAKNGERSPPWRTPPASSHAPVTRAAPVDPMRARTLHELMGMLDELRGRAGLSLRQLVERSRSEPGTGAVPVLARTTVAEFLQGARPPRVRDVLRIVELCGGTAEDLRAWATACRRLLRLAEAGTALSAGRSASVITATATYGNAALALVEPAVNRAGSPTDGSVDDTRRGGPTILRMRLGAQLRRLREARGISSEEAGYEIRSSHSKISRMERGRVGFKQRDVADLLILYGIADPAERASLMWLAQEANKPGWWHRYSDILPSWFEVYLGLEEAASLLRTYELQFVPGLLQTEDYARAVVRLGHSDASKEEVERRVHVRTTRQERFTSPGAPTLWAVLDEAVLRRPLGGREVMRAQLKHLIEVSDLANVTLQVVPFGAGGHTAAGGPFTILRFAEPGLPDVVYLEQLNSALYLDRPADVAHYTEAMNRLCVTATRPDDTVVYLVDILRRI